MEWRGEYQKLLDKAAEQESNAADLDAEVSHHGAPTSAAIRDGSLTKEEIQALAIKQSTATTLASQYRGYANELRQEAEKLKPTGKAAADKVISAKYNAISDYADSEFYSIMLEIEDKLTKAVNLRKWMYSKHRGRLALNVQYDSNKPDRNLELYAALKDVSNRIKERINSQPNGISENDIFSLLNKPSDIAPFRENDTSIRGGLGGVTKWNR